MPDPNCPECNGAGVITIGCDDGPEYHCPACVGPRPITGHPDGTVTVGPFTPVAIPKGGATSGASMILDDDAQERRMTESEALALKPGDRVEARYGGNK
jgi:hypothetical protein